MALFESITLIVNVRKCGKSHPMKNSNPEDFSEKNSWTSIRKITVYLGIILNIIYYKHKGFKHLGFHNTYF